jgi:hypothetical protein
LKMRQSENLKMRQFEDLKTLVSGRKYLNECFINLSGIIELVVFYGGCFPPSGKGLKKSPNGTLKNQRCLSHASKRDEFDGFSEMR